MSRVAPVRPAGGLVLGWVGGVAAVAVLAAHEAVGLFGRYLQAPRLPLWDMAEHARLGLVLARDLEGGRLLRFLLDVNRQDTWPFGYSLLLTPFFLVGGADFAVATLSSTVCFAVAPLLLLWVARELDPGPAGLGAGVLAASLFVLGPVPRLYSLLVMRELAGVVFTLLALGLYLRALRSGTLRAFRVAGLAALALFFVKYNYGGLWLLGVGLHQLVALPPASRSAAARWIGTRLWPWPTRDPRRIAPAVAAYALALLALVGRGAAELLYGLAVAGAVVGIWRLWTGGEAARARWRALPAPARAAVETLLVPIWIWCLSPSPMHLRSLAGFLANRSSGIPLASSEGLFFYVHSFAHDFAPDPRLGYLVLAVAAASGVGLWRAGAASRALALVTAVQLAAVALHPLKGARFLVTAAPLVMLLAAAGLARLAGRTRSGLAVAVPVLAAAVLLGVWLGHPAASARLARDYVVHSADPRLAAVLGFIDAQLPLSGRVAVIGTFSEVSPGVVWWTLYRRRDPGRFALVRPPRRLPRDASPEAVQRAAEDWVAAPPVDRIVGIRVQPSSVYHANEDFQAFNAWQLPVLDRVVGDGRWRRLETRRFPELGLDVVILGPAAGSADPRAAGLNGPGRLW